MERFERTCAEISLDAFRHNYGAIKRIFGETKVMTVMKADAYGHGISGILPACDPFVDWYAVATMEEGREIRLWGSKKPVLLFGPVPAGQMAEAAGYGLTFTVGSLAYAEMLAGKLRENKLAADIHLKIDTGLNRTGFRWRDETAEQTVAELETVCAMDCFTVTGTYSHLACPEPDEPEDEWFTALQVERYERACAAMAERGLPVGLRHIASTGGALKHPAYRFDMVRVGMMAYGQCDSVANAKKYDLIPALCWKSYVTQIEPLKQGEWVSYSRTFRAERDMILGVVSCGYADGYRRAYQNWGKVLVNGQVVRTLGRVCMDYLLIDLTDVENREIGMEVVLLGRQGDREISVIELAEAMGSTCGEVTAAIGKRVTRHYLDGGIDHV